MSIICDILVLLVNWKAFICLHIYDSHLHTRYLNIGCIFRRFIDNLLRPSIHVFLLLMRCQTECFGSRIWFLFSFSTQHWIVLHYAKNWFSIDIFMRAHEILQWNFINWKLRLRWFCTYSIFMVVKHLFYVVNHNILWSITCFL